MKKIRKRNIYIIIMTVIIAVLATACQPTPPQPVVPNKDNGELEAAIQQTPQPTEEVVATDEPPQGIHLRDTRTNESGNITVNIDANVIPQGDDNITVARLDRCTFTKEHLERALTAFFGDDRTYYNPRVNTKADYDKFILSKQQLMTDEEAMLKCDYAVNGGITDIQKIKRHIQEVIDRLVKERSKAPDESPIKEFDYDSEGGVRVDYGEEHMGYAGCHAHGKRPSMTFYAFGGEYASLERIMFPTTITPIDERSNDPTLITARGRAQSFIEAVGIKGVRLGDVYLSRDNCNPHYSGEDAVVSDREYYVFCFERLVGERTIDFTLYDGSYSQDEVSVTLPYEEILVWVEGDKIVQFKWQNPHKITEILNDNTAVQTTYEQALETCAQHLFIKNAFYFDENRAESIQADITRIEFDMIRMKEKNSDYYISVPVWNIYGDVKMRLTEAYKAKRNTIEDTRRITYVSNFMTINALDGSIIDMEKGY